MSVPKVSIIIPSLNVAAYISKCIESVIGQTLKDIEIICVDAKSEDGTLEILKKYKEKDSRIKVIESVKKSYGYQMNLGLNVAKGEYIGIVESDDWVEDDMFESLYNIAKKENVELVKSNYFWYTTKNGEENKVFENLSNCEYENKFVPIDSRKLFETTPAIWSGIYKKEMLIKNKIRFNETPGASYQDTSFHFMVCASADSCWLTKESYLHYRKDNDASSVNSMGKVFCICDEMHYFEEFINVRPNLKKKIEEYYMTLKYEKYRWNCERLDERFRKQFLELMHIEFVQAKNKGILNESQFRKSEWCNLQVLLNNPKEYLEKRVFSNELSQKNKNERLAKTILGGVNFVRKHGILAAIRRGTKMLVNCCRR